MKNKLLKKCVLRITYIDIDYADKPILKHKDIICYESQCFELINRLSSEGYNIISWYISFNFILRFCLSLDMY